MTDSDKYMLCVQMRDDGRCENMPSCGACPAYLDADPKKPEAPRTSSLPAEAAARKDIPLARGCLYYFPAALAAVAHLSKVGNDQHNPGEEMHHARGKSTDHGDCILRHQVDFDVKDTDGVYHATKVAWRSLAQLQELLEQKEGAPLARGARLPGGT
jgi:hypothetical protein